MCGAALGPGTKSVNDGVKRKESCNSTIRFKRRRVARGSCLFQVPTLTMIERGETVPHCSQIAILASRRFPSDRAASSDPRPSLLLTTGLTACETSTPLREPRLAFQAQRRCGRALGGRPRPPWRPHEAGSTGFLSCTLPLKLSWARPRSGVISRIRDILEDLRDWQQIMKIDGQQKPLLKILGPKTAFQRES